MKKPSSQTGTPEQEKKEQKIIKSQGDDATKPLDGADANEAKKRKVKTAATSDEMVA